MQQRRRLAGALTAADDRHALAAEFLRAPVLAGMADQITRQAVKLRWPVFVPE